MHIFLDVTNLTSHPHLGPMTRVTLSNLYQISLILGGLHKAQHLTNVQKRQMFPTNVDMESTCFCPEALTTTLLSRSCRIEQNFPHMLKRSRTADNFKAIIQATIS